MFYLDNEAWPPLQASLTGRERRLQQLQHHAEQTEADPADKDSIVTGLQARGPRKDCAKQHSSASLQQHEDNNKSDSPKLLRAQVASQLSTIQELKFDLALHDNLETELRFAYEMQSWQLEASQDDIASALSQIEQLTDDGRETDKQIAKLQTQLAKSDTALAKLQAEHARLLAGLDKAFAELQAQHNEEIAEKDETLQQFLQEQHYVLVDQLQLSEAEALNSRLGTAIIVQQSQLTAAKESIASLKADAERHEQSSRVQDATLVKVQTDLDSMTQGFARLAHHLTATEGKLKVQTTLNEGNGRYLEAIRSKHTEALKTLRTELAHKDGVLRQLQQGQSNVLSLRSQLSDSHALVATLIADGSAQLADLTEARNTIEVLRADIVQREERHRVTDLKLVKVQVDLNSMTQGFARLAHNLTDTEGKLKVQTMLNEGNGRHLEAIHSKHREALDTLRTELAHKDCVLRQLRRWQSDVSSLHSQLSDSHNLVATLIADRSTQLTDSTQAHGTIEALRADIVQREQHHRAVLNANKIAAARVQASLDDMVLGFANMVHYVTDTERQLQIQVARLKYILLALLLSHLNANQQPGAIERVKVGSTISKVLCVRNALALAFPGFFHMQSFIV